MIVIKDGLGVAKQMKTTVDGTDHVGHQIIDSSALPTGAATAAAQGTANGYLATLAGTVSANQVAVSIGSIALPTGASTAAHQVTSHGYLATLAGAVSGAEMQVDVAGPLPAGTNNIGDVDVVSSVLPTGASTAALQGTANTELGLIKTAAQTLAGAVSTAKFQVDVVTAVLPSGAASSSLQTTGNEYLADLVACIDGVAGTELRVDVITSALPTGAATDAHQVTQNGYLATLAGAVGGTEVQVDVVAPLPAGTNNIGDVDVLSLPALPAGGNTIGSVNLASAIPAGANTIGGVNIASALPAGTNNIGDVDVLSLPALPAGTNNIGDVDVASVALGGTVNAKSETVAATATRFNSAASITVKGAGIKVKALASNSGTVYIGASGVSTSTGYPLAPGESELFEYSDVNLLYHIGTASDVIRWECASA